MREPADAPPPADASTAPDAKSDRASEPGPAPRPAPPLDQGPPVDEVSTFPASTIVAGRLSRSDPRWPAPPTVTARRQQGNLHSYLSRFGEEACRHAGLRHVVVPARIHDVTYGRSPQGDLDYCDMIASLHPLREGERVLDFGCSSGRVIRNLKATHPGIEAEGCDPREASIAFIREHVPEVRWFVSRETPPLPGVEDDRYDLVFAISVWSHFSERAALAWFSEMARVMRPGGDLIFSTHGERSVFHNETVLGSMNATAAQERRDALARGELHFRRASGSDLNDDWGITYMPRAWIERHLSDDWMSRDFRRGMAKRNQDVHVLRRR